MIQYFKNQPRFYALLKFSVWVALLFAVANGLAALSLFALSRSAFYKPSFLVNTFDTKEPFAYIVLGSSRGLTTLDTKQIDSKLGIRGINLSVDDTSLPTHLLMAKHFFESGYHSDLVILALDSGSYENEYLARSTNDYRFLPFVNRPYVRHYFEKSKSSFFDSLSLSRYLPLFGVSYYNLETIGPSIIATLFPQKRNRFDSSGNLTYPKTKAPAASPNKKMVKLQLTNPQLTKLERYVNSHNAELILYTAPYQDIEIQCIDAYFNLINHSNLLKDANYFYDSIHVNKAGRELATKAFIEAFDKINQTTVLLH